MINYYKGKQQERNVPTKFSGMVQVFIFCLLVLGVSGCRSRTDRSKELVLGKEIVLRLEPGPGNPRNSEGDFITLKNGRILYIYTHYTGASGGDNDSAYLASRYSDDQGKTWSRKSEKVIEQEGRLNIMSVSLLRLQNGEIALFYLVPVRKKICG